MVKVSVIVPVYNVENYIAQCLDSIICQTLSDIEIICVNDGSTDDSLEILKAYEKFDKRITVIDQENTGVSGARNTGLSRANGEYAAFFDSDDFVSPVILERLYTNAKKYDSDYVYCNVTCVDTKSGKNFLWNRGFSPQMKKNFTGKVFCEKDLDSKEYFDQHVMVWNKLYKKEFLDSINLKFYEGLIFEDYLFFTKLFFNAQRISFDPDPLYFYRYNREGSIIKAADKRYFDIFKISEEVVKTVKNSGEWEKYKMPLLLKNVKDLLYYYSLILPEYKEEFFNRIKDLYKGKSFADYDFDILLQNKPFRVLMELLGKDYSEIKDLSIDLRVFNE